jgi:uncharacterized protein DUF3292
MVIKSTEFFVGFGFFGDPIIQRGLSFINRYRARHTKPCINC